jgi:hypothetical protein
MRSLPNRIRRTAGPGYRHSKRKICPSCGKRGLKNAELCIPLKSWSRTCQYCHHTVITVQA